MNSETLFLELSSGDLLSSTAFAPVLSLDLFKQQLIKRCVLNEESKVTSVQCSPNTTLSEFSF